MHVDEKDTHHRLRREARRPARHSRPAGHGAGLDGHLRLPAPSSSIDLLRRDADDAGLEPRLRQGHHPLHRQARQGGRPPLRRLLRALERRGRRLLARRRHRRRLLGSQHRPHRHHPRARPLRHATGRSGPMPRSSRRRSSSTTRTAAAARRSRRLVSGDCIVSGASLRRTPALHRRARQLLLRASRRRWCCPTVEIGRNARLRTRRHRPRRAASPKGWWSARTRRSTPGASAAPRRASA